jgi:hypothetical protein
MIDFKQLDLNVYGILMKYFIKDKDTFTHSIAVAGEVKKEGHIEVIDFKKGTEILYKKAYIVALLHDILEDTDCTEEELREIGCDEEIIDAIKSVTRKPEEKYYFDFIKRVSQNKIGTIVKIHDLEHNMDIRRLSKFGDYEQKRLKKYWYSWKYLKGEMKEDKVIKNIGTIV